MIKYETATPKHFIAIAKSNKTATLGHVSLDIAKKDASRPSVRAAHLDKKYNPVPDASAEKKIKKIPGIIPTEAIAEGYFREKKRLTFGGKSEFCLEKEVHRLPWQAYLSPGLYWQG